MKADTNLTVPQAPIGDSLRRFVRGSDTMKRIVFFIFFAALTTTGLQLGAVPQTDAAGDKLLAAAKHKARDDGDVTTAIAMYKEIAANAGTNRALAAQALLGAAECYETLGRPEAKATYELIVAEYATTGAAATTARTKLAAMGQKGAGLVARQVWDGSGDAVTPDGRYLIFMGKNDDLAVHDLASGRDRYLTNDGNGMGSYADFAAPSPDSRLIAYNWVGPPHDGQLLVIGIDGGQSRVVYTAQQNESLRPWGWSPDGKSVLITVRRGGAGTPTRDLVAVPVGGGATHLIKRFEGVTSQGSFSMSPDGRFVAYDRPTIVGKSERDVFLVSIENGLEAPVIAHSADDRLLGWFPAGNQILFSSDRGGSRGIWAARVVDGHAQGEPMQIRRDTGAIRAQGFTRKGDFYYASGDLMAPGLNQYEVYFATLNPATGKQVGGLTRLEGRYTGFKHQAAWSPDGDRIAYVQLNTPGPGPVLSQTLAIQTISTGEVRPLTLAMQSIQNPAWLPDGRSLIVQGTDLQRRQGLFLVNIENGALTAIVEKGDQPALSPEGRRVFFRRTGDLPAIVARDLGTGAEQEVSKQDVASFALSPDGRWIAATQDNGPDSHLFVIPSSGGDHQPLASVASGWTRSFLVTWSHDSRFVIVVKNGEQGNEIWQVPLDGSAPRNTGISWAGETKRISAHPDGRRLALSTTRYASELWVLQNLPELREK